MNPQLERRPDSRPLALHYKRAISGQFIAIINWDSRLDSSFRDHHNDLSSPTLAACVHQDSDTLLETVKIDGQGKSEFPSLMDGRRWEWHSP